MSRGLLAILIGIAAGFAVLYAGWRAFERKATPSPETIAAASLQGLREQNKLSAFAARFVAVVTSTQTRFGVLSAKKTLIMPGLVEYQVDLSKLRQEDVRWNAGTKTLLVALPPVEVSPPQIDLRQVREYDSGGFLMALTDAESTLDAANRNAAQGELAKQARESVTMALARDATRRAVARSFAMPLRAAGIDAKVDARFAGEPAGRAARRWDESTPPGEVYGNGG